MTAVCSSVKKPLSNLFVNVSLTNLANESRRHHATKRMTHPEYCIEQVRKYDFESYLSSLLLPKESRGAVFAIRAYNVEISQIRDIVSDKNIGLMRIQFWKDSLERTFKNDPPVTPVTMELSKKENIMDPTYFKLEELEKYAEHSVSSVNYLLLETLGVRDVHADHAASHIGKAQGLVTLLRATPFHANRNRCYLPTELLMKYGVSQEDVMRGCREQNMKDLTYEVASIAKQHLEKAQNLKSNVPKKSFPAFLSTAALGAYLQSLQRVHFDVFDGHLQQRNNWLPFLLWFQNKKKTY